MLLAVLGTWQSRFPRDQGTSTSTDMSQSTFHLFTSIYIFKSVVFVASWFYSFCFSSFNSGREQLNSSLSLSLSLFLAGRVCLPLVKHCCYELVNLFKSRTFRERLRDGTSHFSCSVCPLAYPFHTDSYILKQGAKTINLDGARTVKGLKLYYTLSCTIYAYVFAILFCMYVPAWQV